MLECLLNITKTVTLGDCVLVEAFVSRVEVRFRAIDAPRRWR